MTANLIPFPRGWFDQQIEQSEPLSVIRAEIAELRATIADIRSETAEYQSQLDDLQRRIEELRAQQTAGNIRPLPEGSDNLAAVDDNYCLCGFGSADSCENCNGIIARMASELAQARATGKCEYGFGTTAEHVAGSWRGLGLCVCTTGSVKA
jgi:FtsZ-binding cell division protein ZapB